jgi:threonine synthase
LARTEGVLTEPAGGAVVAAARKLIAQGRVGRDDDVVLCLTGGAKSLETIRIPTAPVIVPTLAALRQLIV